MCQDDLGKFLSRIQSQLKLYRDFDPFHQVALRFPGSVIKPASLRLETLKAGPQAGDFSIEFDLDQHLDLSGNPVLSRLSASLAIEPLSTIHPAPLRNPAIVALNPMLRFPVAKDVLEDAAMLGAEPLLLRPSSGAYRLWRRGEIIGLGCGGAEGLFRAPAFWLAPNSKEEHTLQGFGPMAALFKPESKVGIQLRFFQGALAIQRGDEKKFLMLELSSKGEEEFKLLDLQKVSDGYVLLMEITGYSRPYGGSSYCGGGEESDLVWIVLSRELEVKKQSSALINSCFKNVESSKQKIEASGLWFWENDFGKRIVQYDPKKPLNGLVPFLAPKENN
jgi:hypothetical protein